jgi:hypothetical protein
MAFVAASALIPRARTTFFAPISSSVRSINIKRSRIAIAQLRSKLLEQYGSFNVVFERFHGYAGLIEFMQGHWRFTRAASFQQARTLPYMAV